MSGMRARLLALAALAALPGCATGGATFDGVYAVGFETQAFWSAEGEGPWWVDGRGAAGRRLENAVRDANAGLPWGTVRVELRGALSDEGEYGHLGAYERRLTVYEVISVQPMMDGVRG
jgi:hypothetical protein